MPEGQAPAANPFDSLRRDVEAQGLDMRGAFHPDAADAVPDMPDGTPSATLVLLGFAGGARWPHFAASGEAHEALPNPLDRWSRRVLGQLAGVHGAQALYPFPTDTPPWHPFQRWAQKAEAVYVSPLRILIHPLWGLWHSYRGALAFGERMALPAQERRSNPCDSCSDRPCLSTCPVSAFSAESYDVARCVRHIQSEDGTDCVAGGCRARRACPVGREHAYRFEQASHHMRAFRDRTNRPQMTP
jgi:hypothetical protein